MDSHGERKREKEKLLPYWRGGAGKKKAESSQWSEPDAGSLEEDIPGAAGHPHRTDEAPDNICSYTDDNVATEYQIIEPDILHLALKRLKADYNAFKSNAGLKEATKQKHMDRITTKMNVIKDRLNILQEPA